MKRVSVPGHATIHWALKENLVFATILDFWVQGDRSAPQGAMR